MTKDLLPLAVTLIEEAIRRILRPRRCVTGRTLGAAPFFLRDVSEMSQRCLRDVSETSLREWRPS